MGNNDYLGDDKKFAITINSQGFNMNTDPWKVTIVNGKNKIICDRNQNTVKDEHDQWYLLVDTMQLGVGTPKAIIEIDVPDTDFIDDHYRHEVYSMSLKPIVKP